MFEILEKDNKLVEWMNTELHVTADSIEKWLMAKDFKTYIRIPKI
jgi:hypothetical protein